MQTAQSIFLLTSGRFQSPIRTDRIPANERTEVMRMSKTERKYLITPNESAPEWSMVPPVIAKIDTERIN